MMRRMLEAEMERRKYEAAATESEWRARATGFHQNVDMEHHTLNSVMGGRHMRSTADMSEIEGKIQAAIERRQQDKCELNRSHPMMLATLSPGSPEPIAYRQGSYMESLLTSARRARGGASPVAELQHVAVPGDGSVAAIRKSVVEVGEHETQLKESMEEMKAKIEMVRDRIVKQPEPCEELAAEEAPQHQGSPVQQQQSLAPPSESSKSASPVIIVPKSTPERMDSDRYHRLRQLQARVNAIPPAETRDCLLYTSDAADEEDSVDLGGRRIIKKKKKK
eukprot:TRINITY_DN29375_c0_g1_i2.p1 TRINITY_DN29375_c0_g1~~TRINITY_DN29375_c0_g1_i2.p1  ORF type:complete len:279 (+),score=91.39 TRINITY_DN29375_c0_g1_i2:204-1040(+)